MLDTKSVPAKTRFLAGGVADNIGLQKVLSALLYAVSSFLMLWVNKIVLTSFGFPSPNFLAFCQSLFTIFVLSVLNVFGLFTIPHPTNASVVSMLPQSICQVLNTVTGLAGTKSVSLPMFTVLRRISILMTMVAEWIVFKQVRPSTQVGAVLMMVGGTVIAAVHDLTYSFEGYICILLNDIFTAAQGILVKHNADNRDKFGSDMGVLYLSNLFALPVYLGFLIVTDQLEAVGQFDSWGDPRFVVGFLVSSSIGCLLQYSQILSTRLNSPLTTAVVGCMKNTGMAYIGMLVDGYLFSMHNFIGINISVLGSLIYSYVDFSSKGDKGDKSSAESQPRVTV